MGATVNKWANAMESLAPAAGQPGRGAGNIPYAPGVMSGKYPGISGEAQRLYSNLDGIQKRDSAVSQMGNMLAQGQSAPQGEGGSPTPSSAPPPPMPNSGMEQQQHVLQYIMSLLRPNSGMTITTTGGFMDKGKGY